MAWAKLSDMTSTQIWGRLRLFATGGRAPDLQYRAPDGGTALAANYTAHDGRWSLTRAVGDDTIINNQATLRADLGDASLVLGPALWRTIWKAPFPRDVKRDLWLLSLRRLYMGGQLKRQATRNVRHACFLCGEDQGDSYSHVFGGGCRVSRKLCGQRDELLANLPVDNWSPLLGRCCLGPPATAGREVASWVSLLTTWAFWRARMCGVNNPSEVSSNGERRCGWRRRTG